MVTINELRWAWFQLEDGKRGEEGAHGGKSYLKALSAAAKYRSLAADAYWLAKVEMLLPGAVTFAGVTAEGRLVSRILVLLLLFFFFFFGGGGVGGGGVVVGCV